VSEQATVVLAMVIVLAHVTLFALGWLWAARSRHLGFLALIGPAAVVWALAGFPLVRDLTYGTRKLGPPNGTLETFGLIAVLLGFGAFFVCAIGSFVTVARQGSLRSPKRAASPSPPRRR
jgi:hypothetical protein